jgi:hypothetical protein
MEIRDKKETSHYLYKKDALKKNMKKYLLIAYGGAKNEKFSR